MKPSSYLKCNALSIFVCLLLVFWVLPPDMCAQTAGLVASYSFNEGTGTSVSDSSGNGHTGTIQNAAWTPSGKYGAALMFNGLNALVTISDAASLHLTTAMTLEAWVNPSTVNSAWRDVIYKGNDNYYLEGTSTTRSAPAIGGTFGSANTNVFGTAALSVNTWAHLAATYDGATLRLYVNGTQVASKARTGNLATSANPLQIGGDSLNGQNFNGIIDEVRIYNVALTQAQIQSDMNTPVGSFSDTQAPTTPSNLSATAVSSSQINLTWTASTDNVAVTGYLVESCITASCTFTQIGTTASASFNSTGLTAGTGYSYRVRAIDAAGNTSAYSTVAGATTPAVDTQPPTTPSNLTATAASSSQINLSWTASTDNIAVTNYLIESCMAASCTYAQIGTATGTTFNNTGLAANTGYNYRVRATDAAGNLSGYSTVASATTTATISGLVAAYSFNEGTGATVADSSGTGNNGSTTNTTWTASGKYGNALVFNGSNSLVTVPDTASLHLTTAMTLEAWVNPSTVTAAWSDVIYKGNDNYYLEGTSSSTFPAVGGTFGAAGTTLLGTTALAANTWTHLAATYDGATLRLYINGTQVASTARTGNLATSTNALQIGGDSLYGQTFSGMIDEVRIYNVALTQAQIQSDMNTPVGALPDNLPPTAPSNLSASAFSPTQINLSWTASTDNIGVTNYLIEGCITTSCTYAQIGTATGTAFNNTGLTPGTGYSYRVRATDAAGNLSAYSNIAAATTPLVDTQPPTAPSNLTAIAAGSSQINLTWTASTDNVGLHGYSVERCLTAACSFAVIVPYITSTVYNDTGLNPSTSYSYRVQASDSAGNLSAYSNIASASTAAVDTQPPTTPSTLTATTAGASQINLSWTASTDNVAVTNYLIERCVTASCTYAQIGTATGTTFNNTGLAAGTGYSYRVRATDAAGNLSGYSNVASATTITTISGLVAAYSFNEGTGTTVLDSSGTGNNGTITNTTWVPSGKYGNALVFNGSNSLVTIPDTASLHLNAAMTLEAWVNPSSVNSTWRDVLYKGNDNYYLEGTSSNNVPAVGGTFGGANANVFGTATLVANTWTHLAATYDGATLRLYVNGTQVSSTARTGNLATSTNPLQIGGDSLYGQNFSGMIDEVRIYNVALTQSQIQSDMNTPVGSSTPAPSVSLSSSNITFGNQSTGTSSQPQPVSLTNIGSATLHITGVAVTGQNSTDFSQTNTCGASLAPNANCTINITFTPTNTGTRVASIAVSDDAALSPQTISLTGTGVGFSVSPRQVVLTYTMTQQFGVLNGNGSITWSVDGVAGGSPSTGTITATGFYTPPAAVGTHTITATSSTSQSAGATVYVSNYAGTFTFHNDNLRTGQNVNETVLTPANVNSQQFGLLYSYSTDGISHGSPLYVANVSIPGKGFHNIVYVATEHDSVYAFDADGLSATPLWKVSFINGSSVTTVPASDTGETGDIAPEIGITSTPVIDQSTATLYVVAKTKEGSNYVQRLHALDISTGAERSGSPVVLQATVPGTGAGSSGGQLSFNSLRENQRPGLLLSNGVIYIAFASHGDQLPYHGWVLGYNATTLQQVMAYCDSPNGSQGGIWQSGIGLASDISGNVYFMTGNGSFDANTGGREYGDSFVKLSPGGSVVDYFTPHDQDVMAGNNWDLSSSGVMLLPDQPGAVPHLLVGAGKTGTVYLVNRDSMGFYNANNDNQIVQSLVNAFPNGTPEPGNYSAPVYFNGSVYFSPINDMIQAFHLNNGLLTTSPTSRSPEIYPYPGGWMALSANGISNGILWAIQRNDSTTMDPGNSAPGVLRAYLASDLNTEIYNTSQAGSRDTLDYAAKYTAPLVANGKVFILTNSRLMILGLLP